MQNRDNSHYITNSVGESITESNKEFYMEKINPVITGTVEKNRAILNKYGEKFGMEVFTIKEEQLDLDFQKRKMEATTNGGFIMNKPFTRIAIQKIPIISISIERDGDNTAYVCLNKDVEGKRIDCPLQTPKFDVDTTDENIRKAIMSSREGNSNPMYFSNLRKLEDRVTALNRKRIMEYTCVLEDLKAQVNAMTSHIEADRQYTESYYNSLSTSGKESAIVTVVTTETTSE